MDEWFDEISDRISGLRPEAWLVLSPGFVREEWKSVCFAKGKPLTAHAIQSPVQIARILVPEAEGRILEQGARVELLRDTFKGESLREGLPEILGHRFRPKFHESLDRALQKGRELFVHREEAQAFQERLQEKNGANSRRTEYFLLNRLWESVLNSRDFFDEARIFELATARLAAGARIPVRHIYWLSHFPLAPRVRFFQETLARSVELRALHSTEILKMRETGPGPELARKKAHSLEDGAHHLLQDIIQDGVESNAVVIEDRSEVRRTLQRVAGEWGVPLQDARDPTLLPQSEELKAALLELEMSAKDFPRDLILAWIGVCAPDRGDLRRKLLEGNVLRGLDACRFDPGIHGALLTISELYPRRMSLPELELAIGISNRRLGLPAWTANTISSVLGEWNQGLQLLGKAGLKRPIRFWLKELSERLKSATPPVASVRRERGLRVYRVDQAVSLDLPEDVRLHFFGVSAHFFEPREESTEWLSGRDLETLGFEFAIPDRRTRKEGARRSFLAWVARSSRPPVFRDFLYNESGAEEESPELALRSIPELRLEETLEELPVHPRVLPSLLADLKSASPDARVSFRERELPMSFINSLGNCAFTAYAQHILRLFDERDPDFELGGDVYGNLIHSAVELLVAEGGRMDASTAFHRAWEKTVKPAWVRSDRLFSAMRKRAIRLLEVFASSDEEFRSKSGAGLKAQEHEIRWKKEGFVFSGRVDRIDQHADGLVVLDYKTSARQPGGQESLTTGKGLQLAAYALALTEQGNQPVISAQYVTLTPEKTQRNHGVLFKKWNKGKASDGVDFPLSFARSNSTSLFSEDPDAVWSAFDAKITGLLRSAVEQGFRAAPADPSDCDFCRYSGVCGRGRIVLA